MIKQTISFALLFLVGSFGPFANGASAQAFGVNMGDSVSNYSAEKLDDGLYGIAVPQPNSEFERYVATATAETGICRIAAVGKDHENDSYGNSVRTAYKSIQQALSQRYGNALKQDFLLSGSIWNEPDEFGWSLYKKERILASFWDDEEGSDLPPSVQAIVLAAKSVEPSTTYLQLYYEFSNYGKCKEIIDEKDNAGL